MAGIGLYGVYYSKATITGGVVTGYNGVKTMGKAISASYEAADTKDNRLWANNSIAETDTNSSAGGKLTLTLDRLGPDAREDMFGQTKQTATVTVDGAEVTGTGHSYTGLEASNALGVAFIRWKQEDNDRGHYEAAIYGYCVFREPAEEDSTYDGDNGVEWGTTELEGAVSGPSVMGELPWRRKFDFPTQKAAIQYITDIFAAPTQAGGGEE
ncbi:MAG: hypothetical protein IJ705_02915 [Oscillospiraceae bacterium]|nr:hypothetical protein [Oscillospiraceae bacterium]